jgi:hypothetical protein
MDEDRGVVPSTCIWREPGRPESKTKEFQNLSLSWAGMALFNTFKATQVASIPAKSPTDRRET